MSNVRAPDLYPKKLARNPYTPERDKFLREHRDVAPAILADKLGFTERFVIRYQRKLGIRKLTGNPPRKHK